MPGESHNLLYNIHYMLDNTIPIHRTTLSLNSKHHCDYDAAKTEKHSDEEESHSDRDSDDQQTGNDNTYVSDNVVQ